MLTTKGIKDLWFLEEDRIDYYPFGWTMPGRKFTGIQGNYRYGFNGMEKDDEVKNSEGSHYTTLYRQYDSRIGRWFSVDPKANVLPWQSPYCSMDNNPILKTDTDGDIANVLGGAALGAGVELAIQFSVQLALNDGDFETALSKIDWVDVAIAAGEGALTSGMSAGWTLSKSTVKGVLLVGEVVKAGVDLDYEKGITAVGAGKELDDAALDFLLDKAGDKLAQNVLKGVGDVSKQLNNKSIYDTFTKEGKNGAKILKDVVENKTYRITVDRVFESQAALISDSGIKDVVTEESKALPSFMSTELPADNTRVVQPLNVK